MRNILLVCLLLLCCIQVSFADGRPRIHELSDKKQEILESGVVPAQKKEEWGYATRDGKFLIPAVFTAAMPVSTKQVAFVSYINKEGRYVWTPISLKGEYLTDQEFTHVIKDFDEKGLAVVQQNGQYGVINHLGKMVALCSYANFYDYQLAYLFKAPRSPGCVAVVKENSEKGYGVYSFDANEPVILKTEKGVGIVSNKTLKVVAGFEYESVQQIVSGSVYSLHKGGKKYLYAADRLSAGYEAIIPGPSKAYYVVKNNGLYGVLKPNNDRLLECTQNELPVLKKDEYTRFFVNGAPVYVNWTECITAAKYDDYLFNRYRVTPAEYLLEETLDFGLKKHVTSALALSYGTAEFAKLSNLQVAIDYAQNRRYVLLSNDNENAKYLDLATGKLIDAGDVLYHAFPSKSGAPAYASALRSGKFGVLDIRTKEATLPFEYDKITPLKNGYASLQQADSLHLYNVPECLMVTNHACESIDDYWLDLNFVLVKQEGKQRVYSLTQHKWILPEDHTLESFVPIPDVDSLNRNLVAVMKKTGKKALFSLHSGDRLTDYLFDEVVDTLFADKYNPVKVAGKSGLYDVANKRFALQCDYNTISGYYVFDGDEYVVVTKSGKKGVYNLTDKKLVVAILNDDIDMRGGYVRIERSGNYAVYSLEYNRMVFDSPKSGVELMNDGYALICDADSDYGYGWGVYNLNSKYWVIEPGYASAGFCGKDYVSLGYGSVINYKTGREVIYCDNESYPFEVIGNYVNVIHRFGESMWLHKLTSYHAILSGSEIKVISSENTTLQSGNYAIVKDYMENYYGQENGLLRCLLYDLDASECIVDDDVFGIKITDMSYLDSGLLSVVLQNDEIRIFDLMTKQWLMKFESRIESHTLNDYLIIINNGQIYLFDPQGRVMTLLKDNYGFGDYLRFKTAKSLVPEKMHSQYDRISLMYEN